MKLDNELHLLARADELARDYVADNEAARVFPDENAIAGLAQLGGQMPEGQCDPNETLELLAKFGTPAAVTNNGPNYYGFVIGATLPVAAAADRMTSVWDQCASSHVNSPVMAYLEKTAGEWLLDVLDLPKGSGVGFGTSATACGLSALATARAGLLAQLGWDVNHKGLAGAPEIKVIVSDVVHITVKKALRLLGFGLDNIQIAQTDEFGRIMPDALPDMDDRTILCLQAGEVNTGEFDPFDEIIPRAKAAGAWVHVDGAFGLWARASRSKRHFTQGVEGADSWTTDGHKWLNTPYESAVCICRDKALMAQTMNADAVYSMAENDAQKNLTLEFSRKAKGLGFWAVLRTLGREGVEALVDQFCARAQELADVVRAMDIPVHNRVVLNQVLCGFDKEADTKAFVSAVQNDGKIWFGPSIWRGKAAFRLSVSSWRTESEHIQAVRDAMVLHLPR